MKSLVEEASSVVKAIEKAWNRAGCPQTFSVKVFETPETNFFGFTKKSAKVGIFFEEEPAPQQKKYSSQHRDQRSQNSSRPQPKGRADVSYSREEKEEESVQIDSRRAHHAGRQPHQGQRQERSVEPRQSSAPSAHSEVRAQRPQPVSQEDRQDRQPNRERGQRPNNRPARPHRDEQPRQARTEEAAPFVEEKPQFEQPRYEQPRQEREYAPRQEREFEPRREREQESRREFEPRDEQYPRQDREEGRRERGPRDRRDGDRRSSSRADRNDRDRGGRNSRPQRAQRHEFEEQRPLFNEGTDQAQPMHDQVPHAAPEVTNAPSLVPQKKVLKVSGRRYSAPVKKTDE